MFHLMCNHIIFSLVLVAEHYENMSVQNAAISKSEKNDNILMKFFNFLIFAQNIVRLF